MKTRKLLNYALSLWAVLWMTAIATAETQTIYAEDFSALTLDTTFTNQAPWWSPNWNGGDTVTLQASADGPDGAVAITRSTNVIAGRFYGGGIRGPIASMEFPAGAATNPEDLMLSLWVKATSSQARGPIGISVISKDEDNANTGAVYYKLPIVPADWTEISLSFADMEAGVPNIETEGFDFSSPRLQVFIWMRTEYEDGWPFQEDENHTYSVSVADIRIELTEGNGGTPDSDIYEEDFSSLELDTVLTNQSPWWSPNWNGADPSQSTASTDGPDGLVAFTRSTVVNVGGFHGGGIRGPVVPFTVEAGTIHEDVTLSLWVRGESTLGRGAIGISVISKDDANANTGAVYYHLNSVPDEWTPIVVNFADMRAGVPNIEEGDFDFNSPRLQVFVWMRTDYEDGWPIIGGEDHTYSVSLAHVRITTDELDGNVWNGYIVADGWVDTGSWMGTLYVNHAPWVYSVNLGKYIYIPQQFDNRGSWSFILAP